MTAGTVTQTWNGGRGDTSTSKPSSGPLYSMQAYFEGKMSVDEFARSEEEKPTVAYDEFDETLPVIDIAALQNTNPEARKAQAARMLDAAMSWGFFKVTNHGVPIEVVRQVEANAKEFFALPMERKLPIRAPDFVFGYTGGSPIKWKSKWWLEGLQIKVLQLLLLLLSTPIATYAG